MSSLSWFIKCAAILGLVRKSEISRPHNYFPNSQFEINTAMVRIPAFKLDGTQFSAFTMTSHTTGSNTVVATLANTTDLRVGMIGIFGGAADASLIGASTATPGVATAVEITAMTSTTITFDLALGKVAAGGGGGTFTPVMRGDDVGTGNAGPDGIFKSANLKLWVEDDPTVLALFPGAYTVLGWKRTDSADAAILYEFNHFQDSLSRIIPWHGRTIAVGNDGKVMSGATVYRALILHGAANIAAFGPQVSEGWTEATTTVDPTSIALNVGAYLQGGASGDWGYFALPVMAAGRKIGGASAYSKPPNERLSLRVKHTPESFFGNDVTFPATTDGVGGLYGFGFNLYAETSGALRKTLAGVSVMTEGQQSTSGAAFAVRNQLNVPHRYGPIFFTQVNSRMMSANGDWLLEGGKGYIYTTTSAAAFTSVSLDINAAWSR